METKIIDARGKKNTYGELEQGQYFLYDGVLYVKTDIKKDGATFAVALRSGDFAVFSPNALIEKVTAEIKYY